MEAELETSTGMLQVVAVNDLMADMVEQPDPAPLFDCLWFEGELACLFADSNVGKSIFAVQMAEDISAHQPVLYVDCELTNKQFQLRYSNSETGQYHVFPPAFFRATIAPERIGSGDFENCLLRDIEKAASLHKCRVIILDNLTYACNTSEKGDAAGQFMMRLKRLQMTYGWSLLIIAHTPKREEDAPIAASNLAGSKKLFNFFDSIFALGKSRQDDNFRYLKQLKVRSGEFTFTEENVAVFELEKSDDGSLHFIIRKYDSEEGQLNPFREDDLDYARKVVELHNNGMSYRVIGDKLGISKSRAQRIYKKYRAKAIPMEDAASMIDFDDDCPDDSGPMDWDVGTEFSC